MLREWRARNVADFSNSGSRRSRPRQIHTEPSWLARRPVWSVGRKTAGIDLEPSFRAAWVKAGPSPGPNSGCSPRMPAAANVARPIQAVGQGEALLGFINFGGQERSMGRGVPDGDKPLLIGQGRRPAVGGVGHGGDLCRCRACSNLSARLDVPDADRPIVGHRDRRAPSELAEADAPCPCSLQDVERNQALDVPERFGADPSQRGGRATVERNTIVPMYWNDP